MTQPTSYLGLAVRLLAPLLGGLISIACGGKDSPSSDADQCQLSSCGALPEGISYSCADGTKGGPTGLCKKSSTGTCEWEIGSCPSACQPGEKKSADDGCNTCNCASDGTWSCTEEVCANSTCVEDQCGAKPHSVSQFCSDGSIGGFTGQCLRNADGTCGWEMRTCPSSCTYNGSTYVDGATYPANDSCNSCKCNNGNTVCSAMDCVKLDCIPNDCGLFPPTLSNLCPDGSKGGATGKCLPNAAGTCSWEVLICPNICAGRNTVSDGTCVYDCNYNGRFYAYGEVFPASDGCNLCTCEDAQVICTELPCAACSADDPKMVEGGCKICEAGVDQTCNDDPNLSSLAGTCRSGVICQCRQGFGPNPTNGKCRLSTAGATSACTPSPKDGGCNGEPVLSDIQGRCLYDGTCHCYGSYVTDATMGSCVRAIP